MEEDDEGRNRKHVTFTRVHGEEIKGKHRRNWYHFISTPYSQVCDYQTGGYPNCLTVYVVKKL